jgi:cyclophilin family peptidyl-prolyl cis-trans isomerase
MDKTVITIFPLLLLLVGGVWYFMEREPSSAPGDAFAYSTPAPADTPDAAPPASSELNPQPIVVQQEQPTPLATNPQQTMYATIHTNKGDITVELFSADAPNTVANFVKLAGEGFYNGTKFHRVIPGFMIQGGDPLTKDDSKAAQWGTGGPGYQFADELRANNRNDIGTISMANSGPNTNGSQFFINTAANNFLDDKHTTFGKVTAGMDVVTAIEQTPTGPGDRPVEPMIINSITVE